MIKRISVSFLIAVFLIAGGMLGGCRQPAQKPSPSPSTTPAPAKKPASSPSEAKRVADRAAVVAAKVPGVQRATVVVSGKTAFVGLDIKADVEKNRTNAIKDEVARRIKAAEPSLTTVNVTTDPDLVTRIKRIANGIKKGKPISSFASELEEIGRRITPRTT